MFGEEVIELAFIHSKVALEPNIIEAELLNQPVKFSVERPVSQDVMDRQQRGLRFHRIYADATQRRLLRVRSMVKEGTDV